MSADWEHIKNKYKHILPLAVRTKLKWVWYLGHDIYSPIRAPFVPPRRKTFIGGGDFINVGQHFTDIMISYGLNPYMDVLDIGSGQGRMARPLIHYLKGGSYRGFDINKGAVKWCQDQYEEVPHFHFSHWDIHNKLYNPQGRYQAKDYRFAFEAETFDCIMAASVFTHMFSDDIEVYINEMTRLVHPKGRIFATWFLLNDEAYAETEPLVNFKHHYDAVSDIMTPKVPEAAVAFDEEFVLDLYRKAGLKIVHIEYGKWARPDSPHDLQDLIIAEKMTAEEIAELNEAERQKEQDRLYSNYLQAAE